MLAFMEKGGGDPVWSRGCGSLDRSRRRRVNVEENDEECHDVWGKEGQVRLITLYGVDQAEGGAVMIGGVSEGEGRGGSEYRSGVGILHVVIYEKWGRHVGKRNAKIGELDSRGAGEPIEEVGALRENRGGVRVGVPRGGVGFIGEIVWEERVRPAARVPGGRVPVSTRSASGCRRGYEGWTFCMSVSMSKAVVIWA